jgi:CheY-like chemotaxis protein
MTEGDAEPRVLVVTADEEVRVLLRRLLRSIGYEVDVLEAGDVAARLEADRPALVVLDLGIPRRGAWPLLSLLPQLSAPPPVIALVPRGDYRGLAKAIREGTAASLLRPFHADDFVSVCQAVMAGGLPSAPSPDRRLGTRRIVVAGVTLASADGAPLGPGEMVDLGTGGAQVRLPARVEAGTRVRLTLPAPMGRPLEFGAVVQWSGRARSGFAHGLQFVDLTLALRRQLGDLLEAATA